MSKPAPLKGKGSAAYESSADAIVVHFSQEDVRNAVEWLKDSINSDLFLKSGIICTAEKLLFDKIDEAFSDVLQEKKQPTKKK
jgi:hypothetical protein